ncbi:mediator of RNA polymerase II transcription subunit 29 [Phymastichus coffea]|uniref:mediator of RNA polymerase II transcription subunit 29 n=1 Tax=Phymastichus coffea TaxID=108790 RepID=UPI00273C8EF4|nr:mediator of RNA polymerase II transcription subunit 29 [Phymastichus coffea]XP_058793404.1 mediator of RNA polymerase II transcription subunit 29 [Phymastichus coffea]XP_058793406.1 mediator of RNA polymerase II transcription subunit 29 [Phymastichus coffea]XP_058793407.1 mediator of RNA polymerase II transcription subunit 29 [Phymastichus coffea]
MNMNIPGMQQPGPMGMNQMVQPNTVPMGPAQHGMHPQAQMQQPQQPQEKGDSISKVKGLVSQLRDSLSVALKTAGHTLLTNSLIDTSKSTEPPDQRFNKSIEEFYSICDQMELHLRTSIECIGQNVSSTRYMPIGVTTRTENVGVQDALTYPQYLLIVRSQVQYVKLISDMLTSVANKITNPDQQQ